MRPRILRGLRGKLERTLYLKIANLAGKPNARQKPDVFERVLLISLQNLGDWLVLVPALRALAHEVGEVHVHAREPALSFLQTLPFIKAWAQPPTGTCYDAVIDFQDTFTTIDRAMLAHQVPARWRIGVGRGGYRPWQFDEWVEKTENHMTEHAIRMVSPCLKVSPTGARGFLWPILAAGQMELQAHAGAGAEGPRIGLHVPNKNRFKRWSAGHFATLVNALAREYPAADFFFTGLKTERDQLAPVFSLINPLVSHRVHDLSDKLSAPGLVEFVRSLDLLVSVDTSLPHLAALTGTATVAIFGPTLLSYWGTWGENQASLSLPMPCRPKENLTRTLALDDRCCIYDEPRCLTELKPEQVLSACRQLLEKHGR